MTVRNNRNAMTGDIVSTGLKDGSRSAYEAGYDQIDWSKRPDEPVLLPAPIEDADEL